MKTKFIFYLILLVLITLLITSCGEEENEFTTINTLFTFNVDGSEQIVWDKLFDGRYCSRGVIEPFHNSRRFAVCDEDLFIFDPETKDAEVYLKNIYIDDDYEITAFPGFGISYDDRYFAFTSGHQVYCFDLNTETYTRLTTGHSDEFPAFGIDNRIYFSRLNNEKGTYRLMSMELDGSGLQEICENEKYITKILPGQVDTNDVYFVGYWQTFYKVEIDTGEKEILYDSNIIFKTYSRTNDDRYFNFSSESNTQYLYDTQTNTVQTYLYPAFTGKCISVIMPDQKIAFLCSIENKVYGMLWDIDSNIQISEEFYVERSYDGGEPHISISSDGTTIALFHERH